MLDERIVSKEVIEEMTGSPQPAKQAEILAAHGVYFITRLDGKIRTTWHHFNNPATRAARSDNEPNFASISEA
jgi:hypothetical protein